MANGQGGGSLNKHGLFCGARQFPDG